MRVAGHKPGFDNVGSIDQFSLLRNLAEDLKLPLTQIINQSDDSFKVQGTALSGIHLIDTYILCNKIISGQQQLIVEPISLRPLFDDVAHKLAVTAKKQKFVIENQYPPRTPSVVLSDKKLLSSLLSALGYSILQNGGPEINRLQFIIKKQQNNISAGLYSTATAIKPGDLSATRKLKGRASVLSSNLKYGSSSGIAIADTIAQLLSTELTVSKHNNHSGLAVLLSPSRQLSLL